MNELADAIRKVTATIQRELDAGRRSSHLDANDLVDVLLAVADEIDRPFASQPRNDRSPKQPRRDQWRPPWPTTPHVRHAGAFSRWWGSGPTRADRHDAGERATTRGNEFLTLRPPGRLMCGGFHGSCVSSQPKPSEHRT